MWPVRLLVGAAHRFRVDDAGRVGVRVAVAVFVRFLSRRHVEATAVDRSQLIERCGDPVAGVWCDLCARSSVEAAILRVGSEVILWQRCAGCGATTSKVPS